MAVQVLKAEFRDPYWEFYHGRDEIVLKSLDELPADEVGVRLVLQPGMEGFSHFLYSVEDAPFSESEDDGVVVHFKDEPSAQHTTVVVKAICQDGRSSTPYTVKLSYYPSTFYEANRMAGYPNIIMVGSSPILNFSSGTVDDWVCPKPTVQERAYASRKWGALIKDADSDYEKAKRLATSLMDDLWPHNGFPSDEMKVPPFEQYERMLSGKDKGFCSNFAEIFVCACNALGVPARRVHMESVHSASDKCRIQIESMHSTTEVFDGQSNQWVWMDLRFYALGAYLGEEGPLNLAELHFFLDQPARRKRLRLHIYHIEDKSEEILPLDECPKKTFGCFEGWDTEFHYTREIK